LTVAPVLGFLLDGPEDAAAVRPPELAAAGAASALRLGVSAVLTGAALLPNHWRISESGKKYLLLSPGNVT
jgi:hypothetical protein